MLADPRRLRLLIAATVILLAGLVLRVLTPTDPTSGPPGEVAEQAATPSGTDRDSSGSANTDERSTDPGPVDEPDRATVDTAREVAALFAAEYLTSTPDEDHAERTARITAHTTDRLTDAIAAARRAGTADADQGPQEVEVVDTQTQTVRPRAIEVTVITELTTTGGEGDGGEQVTTPTNLSVVLREEDGAWLVDDLR